jgi:sulfonate transport system substrate-binding protein
MMISRRNLLKGSAAAALTGAFAVPVRAETPKELRIGYQKNGVLVIARQQAALEKHFASISWNDFPAGPPMLEAMNAGSIDFGRSVTRRRYLPRRRTPKLSTSPASRLPMDRAFW